MADVVKHAWTHRPRSQGGTDPIPVSGGPVSAYADAGGLQSRTIPADVSPLTNEQMWMTPGGPYEPDSGNPASFNYIMINQNGWYRADFYIYWSTDFTGGTFPIIRPGCVIDGSPDFLSVAFDDPAFWPGYDNTQSWIGGEQFTAAEMDHHSLEATVYFNLSFAVSGFTTFGISNTLDTTFVGSKNIGGYFTVVRLGDYMEAVT
jgi:hypothetical protein